MLQPMEQVIQQISRTDQQLMYYMIMEQKETNRLLQMLIENKQIPSENKEEKRRGRKPKEEGQ